MSLEERGPEGRAAMIVAAHLHRHEIAQRNVDALQRGALASGPAIDPSQGIG